MTLVYSTTSPFARKVLITAMELGLREQLALEIAHPLRNAEQVSDANPLGKVPCLLTDAGQMVVNSPVICQFLQRLAPDGPALHDPSYMDIDAVERIQALADGVMEAAVALVMETLRPEEQHSDLWVDRWISAIERTLTYIERYDVSKLRIVLSSNAEIALACALGYLDFRLPELDWRDFCPELDVWYSEVAQAESFVATTPVA